MSASAVRVRQDDQELGPLEIKTRITERACITNLSLYGILVALWIFLIFGVGTHGHPDYARIPLALCSVMQMIPWVQNLQRVRREGPFEISRPNHRATPEQRRFERSFRALLTITVMFAAGIPIVALFLLGHSGYLLVPVLFLLCVAMMMFVVFRSSVIRKRLAADAVARVQAAQNAGLQTAPAVASGGTNTSTGTGHWWTQSALRPENDTQQQLRNGDR